MALSTLFGGAYAGRRVLVTGHTGFKGSWLALWLRELGAHVAGLALAPNTTPAHWDLLGLDDVADHRVDLRNADAVRRVLEQYQPEVIFHLAAKPLVRRSYAEPVETFATNVMGLVNLLEAVRACTSTRAVVNVTTDKVYLDQPTNNGYNEACPLGGHDPYSTSKACAELVSDCYRKSYFRSVGNGGARIATARAGNVIGGGDWSEDRLVSDLIRAAVANTPLRLRNPDAVRPWQHVLEPLSGYLRLGQGLLAGEPVEGPWNFGPADDATVPVATLVARMRERWPSVLVEPSPGPHPHEASTLRLDCSKAAHELGWHPVWNAATTVARTVDWYRAFHQHGELCSKNDLRDYITDARAAGIEWAGRS
ncbi:MAG TPA: CDP-glucose 4,6-dehydratase [Rhodanobacter sp.]|jgi:CDP-glucose 4,6-dehydratase|nr:CDP-glucose 4,6-dehydratase [Rhodanobacter sp.]